VADAETWIVGATSVLGSALAGTPIEGARLVATCSRHGRAPSDWLRIDVEKPADWEVLAARAPRTVIYCAGICDTERCDENPDFAWTINVDGVSAMLDALPSSTRLVVCSSDHVFSGDGGPYVESTPPDPLGVYGRSRVEAEQRVLARRPDALVVRVALPIGPSRNGRVGFWDWLAYRHRQGLPMTVVDGEARAAVWSTDAAQRVHALAQSDLSGVLHLAATRMSTRPALAAALCRRQGIEPGYRLVERARLGRPHLGCVELHSERPEPLARPLIAVLDERGQLTRPSSRA